MNNAFAEMHGYVREELIGKHLSVLHTPEQMPAVAEARRQVWETGKFHGEIWHARRDGRVFPTIMQNSVLRDEAGNAVGTVATMRDITARKEAEDALRRSELQYRSTIDSIGDMVHVVDKDLRIVLCNRVCQERCKELGLVEDGVGRTVFEVFPFLTAKVRDEYSRVFDRGGMLVTEETTKVGGKEYVTETRKIPVVEDNEVVRVVTVMRDITERKRLEAELRQSQKMQAVGQLAAGIAHDFNNMMTPVIGYARLLLRDMPSDDPRHKYADVILRTCKRAAALPRQLLAFSRKQALQPEILDLDALIVRMDKMLRRIIGEDIQMITVLAPGLWKVKADRTQIEQVIMNLVVNSREAMPQGGKLAIRTQNVTLAAQEPKPFASAQPGEYVCLAVSDTGEGMAEETIEHIFEPFYTTKGLAENSGLGLSVVYGIVEQHRGGVSVESKLGRGSTFTVHLPASSQAAAEGAEEAAEAEDEDAFAPMPQGCGEGILVVEDHVGVRDFCAKALRANGYTVFQALTAQEATELFERERARIHLVFADVVLPDKDGLQLVEELLALQPGLKVVMTSGYAGEKAQWPAIQERGFPLLHKPYALSDLLRAIREGIEHAQDKQP